MKTAWTLPVAAVALATLAFTAVQASSHREAPLISQDPLADNTDVYAFVSPNATRQGDAHRELHSVRSAVRRAELLQVRRQRALRDHGRQQRRRRRGRHVPVHVPHRRPQPEHVPLQHRPDHVARLRDLQRAAVLHGDAHRRSAAPRPRHGARRRTCRRRRSTSASARRPTTTRWRRPPCVSCRTARRCSPVSATIRSSSTSTCSTCSRVPPADTNNFDALAGFNVHTIAIEVPISTLTANGARPSSAIRSERGHRRVVHGEPAVGDQPRRRTGTSQRELRAGVAARPAARQRGGDPARRQGHVQRARADRRRARRSAS